MPDLTNNEYVQNFPNIVQSGNNDFFGYCEQVGLGSMTYSYNSVDYNHRWYDGYNSSEQTGFASGGLPYCLQLGHAGTTTSFANLGINTIVDIGETEGAYLRSGYGDTAENMKPLGTPTNISLVMSEFSYSPGFYPLPETDVTISHKFVLLLNAKFLQEIYLGFPRRKYLDTDDGKIFGISLERNNVSGILYAGFVCPTESVWANANSNIVLGQAITHTPPEEPWLDPEYVSEEDYDLGSWRGTPGYVLRAYLDGAKERITVSFNGETIVNRLLLPTSIQNYFKEYIGTVGYFGMINHPAVWGGLAFPRNGIMTGMMCLTAVGVNSRNINSATKYPQRMNRLDKLNSSPGWANAGNQGEPPTTDRSALWQRNNAT